MSSVVVDEFAPAGVLGLKPDHGWSRLTTADPPEAATSAGVSGWSTRLIRREARWSTVATRAMMTMMTSGNVHRAR